MKIPAILFCIMTIILLWNLPFSCRGAGKESGNESREVRIVLDPGHGGEDAGAADFGVEEKDLNLQIALFLKEELEQYRHVKVFLTRDGDSLLTLPDRTQAAVDHGAHVLISLHNNASGPFAPYREGCTVLTAQGNYKPDMAYEEQKLACCILSELEILGIRNQGILLRDSENGTCYEDGSTADYYAIIRNGLNHDVPSILIEHAFLDNEEDFHSFLEGEEKIKALAQADARGIAKYYGLIHRETNQVLPEPNNYNVVFVHSVDENPDHNIISEEIFYPSKSIDQTVEDYLKNLSRAIKNLKE